jgi:dipeptidyl aminopeptidase/acylaminoacyl peptidase
LTYIDEDDPPFLIMHGAKDPLVPLGQSVILAKALTDAGVEEVVMRTIAGAGHGDPKFHNEESREIITQFLTRKLKVPTAEVPEATP